MKLRVRSAKEPFVLEVDDATTFAVFRFALEERCGIPADRQSLLSGFPPAELVAEDGDTLASVGVRNGDTLIVKQRGAEEGVRRGTLRDAYVQTCDARWTPARRAVPGDNSCLFHAAAYVLEERSRAKGPEFRRKIAEVVAAYPQKFTADYLGMPNAEYVTRIRDTSFWGGAIELSILSFLYNIEIHVFDLQTQREDRYGMSEHYSRFCCMLFTGNHYDAVAMTPYGGASESLDRVVFNAKDEPVLAKVRRLVEDEFRRALKR
eukprot:m51a1_g1283 hypothetical protein (263) ;mRNA; r:144445-145477